MTVGELISELEFFDEDMEVVIKGSNSMYVDEVGSTTEMEVQAFMGDDCSAVVICGSQQVGAC